MLQLKYWADQVLSAPFYRSAVHLVVVSEHEQCNSFTLRKQWCRVFTIAETGESGMSQRGLARACGKTNPAIAKLVEQLITKSPSKWLEPFVGKDLKLITKPVKTGKQGAAAVVYKSDFCSAAIKHYAFKGDENAQDFLGILGDIGLAAYIQNKTGYAEINAVPKKAQDKLSRILDAPNPWEKMYDKKFCDRISKTYGHKFYREVVYALLTPEEYHKMDRLSETKNRKKRDHCLHQLIEPETRERMKPYLEKIQIMLNSVNTMEDFNRVYFRQFGVWIEERYRDLMEGYWDIVYQEAQESKAKYELSQVRQDALRN